MHRDAIGAGARTVARPGQHRRVAEDAASPKAQAVPERLAGAPAPVRLEQCGSAA